MFESLLIEGLDKARFPVVKKSDLPKDDLEAIKKYRSQAHSTPMNTALWKLKFGKGKDFEPHKELHDSVIKALGHFPASKEDNYVYTGLHKDADPEKWRHSDGGLIYIPAFISSTTDNKEIPWNFAHRHDATMTTTQPKGYVKPYNIETGGYENALKIKIPKGQKVGGSIRHINGMAYEKEFLIKPHQVLRITGLNTVKKNWEHGTEKRITAHILSPEEILANKNHPEVKRMLAVTKKLGIKHV